MKLVFVDRDGVINKDLGYVGSIADFEFIDGIFNCFKHIKKKGYEIVVVTNQSGIGRGYYTENDFEVLTKWMLTKLSELGTPILDVFYCPHTQANNCNCRKPRTGMFDMAYKKYPFDKKNAWMIGDKESDMDAATKFGITNTILFTGGQPKKKEDSKARFTLASFTEIDKYIV